MINKTTLNQFNTTSNELINILSSLNEDKINKKPVSGWTIGQIADHLYRSYKLTDVLMGKTEDCHRNPEEKLPEIRTLFLDFSIKMSSPEEILPTKEWIKKEEQISGLNQRISKIRTVIEHEDLSKLCLDFDMPGFETLTRMEWIGFNIAHTQRHIHQIKELL